MKPLTSWTRKVSSQDRCPKRFYLRYLEPSGIASRFHRLKSVRELGGHVVHVALAEVVKAVANGSRVSDHVDAAGTALKEFDRIIEESTSLPPWTLLHPCQVAELHNGQNPEDEISHWREIIPICVENGLRVMSTLGFRSDAGERTMQAEEEIRFRKAGREHRCVIDVLIRDRNSWTVLDWKCHSITNSDIQQVHFYQDYLAKAENIPHSRLHGFAIDLLREEIMEAHFRPYDQSRVRTPGIVAPQKSADPYPHRASVENCSRCPFAALCADSVIRPIQPVQILGEAA